MGRTRAAMATLWALNGAATFATNSPGGSDAAMPLRGLQRGRFRHRVHIPANAIPAATGKAAFTIEAQIYVNAWTSYSIANSDLVQSPPIRDIPAGVTCGYSQGIWDAFRRWGNLSWPTRLC